MEKTLKGSKGITLIALVITIANTSWSINCNANRGKWNTYPSTKCKK